MNYVFKADKDTIERIITSFDREYFVEPVAYSDYRINYDSCIITVYSSGKVMFQGDNSRIYAASFFGLPAVEAQEEQHTAAPAGPPARLLL